MESFTKGLPIPRSHHGTLKNHATAKTRTIVLDNIILLRSTIPILIDCLTVLRSQDSLLKDYQLYIELNISCVLFPCYLPRPDLPFMLYCDKSIDLAASS